MSHPTNFTELMTVVQYKLWAAILNFIQTSVIASFLDTNVSVSSLYSSVLSILHKLSPFWFSLIFQMAYPIANLRSNESQELQT